MEKIPLNDRRKSINRFVTVSARNFNPDTSEYTLHDVVTNGPTGERIPVKAFEALNDGRYRIDLGTEEKITVQGERTILPEQIKADVAVDLIKDQEKADPNKSDEIQTFVFDPPEKNPIRPKVQIPTKWQTHPSISEIPPEIKQVDEAETEWTLISPNNTDWKIWTSGGKTIVETPDIEGPYRGKHQFTEINPEIVRANVEYAIYRDISRNERTTAKPYSKYLKIDHELLLERELRLKNMEAFSVIKPNSDLEMER